MIERGEESAREGASPAAARPKPVLSDFPCYRPYRFMVVQDLFGDGDPTGCVERHTCLNLAMGKLESCSTCPLYPAALRAEGEAVPHEAFGRTVSLSIRAGQKGLPRQLIIDAVAEGHNLEFRFEHGTNPNPFLLHELASVVSRLRNSGIQCEIHGLDRKARSRVRQFEIETVHAPA